MSFLKVYITAAIGNFPFNIHCSNDNQGLHELYTLYQEPFVTVSIDINTKSVTNTLITRDPFLPSMPCLLLYIQYLVFHRDPAKPVKHCASNQQQYLRRDIGAISQHLLFARLSFHFGNLRCGVNPKDDKDVKIDYSMPICLAYTRLDF